MRGLAALALGLAAGAGAAMAAGVAVDRLGGEPTAMLRLVSTGLAETCLPGAAGTGGAATAATGSTATAVAAAAVDGPGRAERAAAIEPAPPPRAAAVLVVAPARIGRARATIVGIERDGFPYVPEAVVVELSKPAFGLGPFRHVAVRRPDGRFAVDVVDLPKDGFWVVRLEIPVSVGETVALTDVLEIGR